MSSDKDYQRARSLALRYLSYRDRSEAETAEYLGKKGCEDTCRDRALAFLKEHNYLNDRRFAEHWARSRVQNKQFGRYRVQQELIGKGLARDLVEETLDDVYGTVDERDLARAVVDKKLPALRDLDPAKRKRRLAGLLQRKGFSGDIIYQVLE
ncbi:MAG: hypothetical protein GWM98_09010 [Nitrospinaceae bacterium]|nr:regulatory protein RecX [Nitrospinaceae bacterium]NIR54601.1 regulatory protein RecX [Nitrospinaceae bacterium]NIS85023.1 regulatory protein RecX [Nitrospinaceae bacterium]NIT81834.1 regulatory protein RecX [Nitrospinaceae bacterium]NIU44097.1 regulatory protein RecX [Nitrospinaceae bacterium]